MYVSENCAKEFIYKIDKYWTDYYKYYVIG